MLDFENGIIKINARKKERYLSDVRAAFSDNKAIEKILKEKDILIYELYEVTVPHKEGEISHGTSILYPGKIGDEYFMTKGHFHTIESAEIYLCLEGEGYLLMETKRKESSYVKMVAGSLVYVPSFWAHRTINTGSEKFICFYAFLSNAGHDYKTIEENGFSKIFREKERKLVIDDSSRWR